MQQRDDYTGIVLAGGMSRRYGSPKALEHFNGKTYGEIAYEILSSVCSRVIIVTSEVLQQKLPGKFPTVVDMPAVKGKGPLAGIYTAMNFISSDNYVVLPCDMPLMTTKVIKYLIHHYEAPITVATEDDKIQPLVSVWSKDMKATLYQSLQMNQLMMKDFLRVNATNYINVNHLNEQRPVFMNINTKENEKELKKWNRSSMYLGDQ